VKGFRFKLFNLKTVVQLHPPPLFFFKKIKKGIDNHYAPTYCNGIRLILIL